MLQVADFFQDGDSCAAWAPLLGFRLARAPPPDVSTKDVQSYATLSNVRCFRLLPNMLLLHNMFYSL